MKNNKIIKKQARRWLCYGILTGFIGSFLCFVGACQYHHAHQNHMSRTGLIDGTTR